MARKKSRLGRREVEQDLFCVEGLSNLREYLLFRPEAVRRIICKRKYFSELESLKPRVPIEAYEDAKGREDIEDLGPVVFWVHLQAVDYSKMLSKKRLAAKNSHTRDFIVVLDHIRDPRNLGAIARSASFFGIAEIIVANARQVLLTPASIRTAQGAFALVDLVVAPNIARVASDLKGLGYWVACADSEGEALENIAARDYERLALVLGSEDKGVSPLVRKRCDFSVGIKGAPRTIGSLNVSVAGGILFQSLTSRLRANAVRPQDSND